MNHYSTCCLRVQCPLALCLILLSFIPASSLAHPASHKHAKHSARELRTRLHSVRTRIHDARAAIHRKRAQIHQTRRSEASTKLELGTVETRLDHTRASLRRVRSRLVDLNQQNAVLRVRIDAAQHRLEARRRLLAMRVRQNYEQGGSSYMQVLFRSRDVHEYMSRSFYVRAMVESDTKLLADIRRDQQELADDRQQVEAQTREQASLRAQRESETVQYQSDAQRKRELLGDLREQEHSQVAQLQSEEEDLEALEEESNNIATEIRASEGTPRGRVRMLHAWTGSFMRPADGPITSGFGERYHPILHRVRMHTGIDIGAHYGSTIHAAAGGVVISAGSRHGYGNCVIIDHGGGISTLYGHCSVLLVSTGEQVHQGQAIARVGATGLATGPHLHFEVRRNGSPINPRPYAE